ncbi:hypothetical protein ACIQBJ_25880 [Kitasatospora sp. NPDC088391]|uniref:hypothetical protein n=1 Tax=Kitasatospora sp. NPDC088391 TaxID=3364074 RepID=UPI0037F2EA7C
MSLSTRAIAGIAGVVVVGAASLGTGIYLANDAGKPEEAKAMLVVGTSTVSTAPSPTCYNDGKPLGEDVLSKCLKEIQQARKDKKLPKLDVRASDRIGVGVPEDLAEKGWFALTNGGAEGQAALAGGPAEAVLTGVTYSGSKSAAGLLSTNDVTSVTVVAQDKKTQEYYAVWAFDLTNKTS